MEMEILFPGGKKVNALYRGFTIQTDQPVEQGGEGTAPTAFELFLASIGICAGYYVLAFCQERQISHEGIKVVMRAERDEKTKMVDRISIRIELPPDFPEKYIKAVVNAAEQCAVKKHLVFPPDIEISTAIGGKRG